MPEVLCKITKVVGVQGVQALAEVPCKAERPNFLRFIPASLYPGQVGPQSHRLRLPRQEVCLRLVSSTGTPPTKSSGSKVGWMSMIVTTNAALAAAAPIVATKP